MNIQPPIRRQRGSSQRRPCRWLPHRRAGALVTLLAVASALTVSVPSASAQRDEVGEYELKAAILFNLSKFVECPPSAYADSQAPTVVCILGQDPFGDSLKALGQKQDANGRPVSIRRLKNSDERRDCHMLYIYSSDRTPP